MYRPFRFVLASAISTVLPAFSTYAADATPLFSSKTVHLEPVSIHANLTGAKELYLVVTDAGDGFGADWADWRRSLPLGVPAFPQWRARVDRLQLRAAVPVPL